MILVDKQIKTLIETQNLICSGYKPENLHGISYDIQIDSIIIPDKSRKQDFDELNHYNLRSGETIYIKSDIEIQLPDRCIGKIEERNSIIRMGLQVSGPCYQPGHKTYIFLRVHNITSKNIPLYKGQGIAQIMFDYLSIEPEIPYSKDTSNSYQNESNYLGIQGEWRKNWLEQFKKYDYQIDKLEDIENRIYGNILTLMGIFISIFSLLSFNFNAISSQIDIISLLRMDFSLTLLLYILIGAITIIVNKQRGKVFYIVYFIIFTILLGTNILLWLTNF